MLANPEVASEKPRARLITYQGETIVQSNIVEILPGHDFSAGPYQDTIPFSVGSNQTIQPVEESELEFYDAWIASIPEEVRDTFLIFIGDSVKIEEAPAVPDKPWAVITDTEFVLECFPTEKEALDFVEKMKWPIIKPKK